MKTVGYIIFAALFYLFRFFCKVKEKRIFCIMTHDGGKDSNVGMMSEYLQNKKEGYSFFYLRKSDRNKVGKQKDLQGALVFFFVKSYQLATSEFVLMDNVFLPMAYMRFNKRVRIIQLWHGTGTIKRFGQDVNTGRLRKLEKKANSRITHLIVNSDKTRRLYAGAFGIPQEKVFAYGLPITDLLFDLDKIERKKKAFFEQYPDLLGKRLVLYAPTFRDQEYKHPSLALDTDIWCKGIMEDYVLLLRVHPHVAEAFERERDIVSDETRRKIVSMSSYPDISTLLLVSDYLITDYSSVIFDYCLRKRPMIFYAYDLKQFLDYGRGFYEKYEDYVPGPIVKDTKEILEKLSKNEFDLSRIEALTRESYKYTDGKSRERLYQHIFKI